MSSIPRFFVPPDAIAGEIVSLPPEASHHARGVLRLRPGEEIVVLDGVSGVALHCRLAETGGDSRRVEAIAARREPVDSEPRTRITVAQALPKTAEKVEQVLQHGTEVGAAAFLIWPAARSVARLEGAEKTEKRLGRWRGIVQGAAEQSGRGVLPPVEWIPSPAALGQRFSAFDAVFVLHESADVPLRAALEALPDSGEGRLLVIVGPEGGLTDEEAARFTESGNAEAVSLGPRILRTETAALVALAQILYQRGE